MSKEPNQNEEEKSEIDKKQARIYNTLNYIFSEEQKLMELLMQDFASVTQTINGQEKTATVLPISFSTILQAISFALRNPEHTFNLIKLAISPEVYKSTAFQEKILENPKTWDFVQSVGKKLPQIGRLLNYLNFKEFAAGNILDQESLTSIGKVLDNKENLNKLQEIALESRRPSPDTSKIINNILELADTKDFKQYLMTKKEKLGEYIVNAIATQENIDASLEKYGLEKKDLAQISKIIPILIDKPKDLQNVYNYFQKGDYPTMIKALMVLSQGNPEIKTYFANNKKLFVGVLDKIFIETEGIKDYKLKGALYDIIPELINSPDKLVGIIDKYNSKPANYTGIIKDIILLSQENPKIKNYLTKNSEMFVGVLDKVLTESKSLQGYNMKGDLYQIVPVLLNHPDELISIITKYENGQTSEVGKVFVDLINKDQNIKEYFTQNTAVLKNILDKGVGLESYEIKDDVTKILQHLMDKNNAPKIKGLLDSYEEGKWIDLIKKTCLMIEEDEKFSQYMQDNKGDLGKIVQFAADNSTTIKYYIGSAKIGDLVGDLLKDPKSIREAIEGYEKGGLSMAYQAGKLVSNKLLDSESRAAIYNTIKSWALGSGNNKHTIITHLADTIKELEATKDPATRLKLTDIVAKTIENGTTDANKAEANALTTELKQGTFFDNIDIGNNESNVKLHNIDITGSFVGATIVNTSFEGSKFSNCSFTGSAFKDVSFKGAEIDGATLDSLLPYIQKGVVSLDGVKIVGALLNNIDLSGISLKGVDLSGVISVEKVNLQNVDFTNAILPQDKSIWLRSYNLDKATFDKDVITPEMIKQNQEAVVGFIADSIITMAKSKGASVKDEKLLQQNIQKLYLGDTDFGKELKDKLSKDPKSIASGFPVKSEDIHNITDLASASYLMTTLYENRDSIDKMGDKLACNAIADKVAFKLFGEGARRGQDALLVRKAIYDSMNKLALEENRTKGATILNNKKIDSLVDDLYKEIYAKTQNTKQGIGVVYGGITLPEQALTPELTNSLTQTMKKFQQLNILGLDGQMLQTLLPDIKKGVVSLDGVKIVGALPNNLDLTKISFAGADLSEVTAMKGIIINEADFTNAKLPKDSAIIAECFNLSFAKFDKNIVDDKLLIQHKEAMGNLLADSIIEEAKQRDESVADEKALRSNIVEIFASDSVIAKELLEAINREPQIIIAQDVVRHNENISHVSELKDPQSIISKIFEHKNNPGQIESRLVANIIADKVASNLFGEGNNRAQDVINLRESFGQAVVDFAIKNNVSATKLLESKNYQHLIEDLTEVTLARTQYTGVGLITGGIKIPESAFTSELSDIVFAKMEQSHHLKLNELKEIKEIAQDIGFNLFGEGSTNSREPDVKRIFDGLKTSLIDLKKNNSGINITKTLQDKRQELLGKVITHWTSTERTGLTGIYHGNTSYTKAGLATGGIFLSPEKAIEPKLIDAVKKYITDTIGDAVKERKIKQEKRQQIDELKSKVSSYLLNEQRTPPTLHSSKKNEKKEGLKR